MHDGTRAMQTQCRGTVGHVYLLVGEGGGEGPGMDSWRLAETGGAEPSMQCSAASLWQCSGPPQYWKQQERVSDVAPVTVTVSVDVLLVVLLFVIVHSLNKFELVWSLSWSGCCARHTPTQGSCVWPPPPWCTSLAPAQSLHGLAATHVRHHAHRVSMAVGACLWVRCSGRKCTWPHSGLRVA